MVVSLIGAAVLGWLALDETSKAEPVLWITPTDPATDAAPATTPPPTTSTPGSPVSAAIPDPVAPGRTTATAPGADPSTAPAPTAPAPTAPASPAQPAASAAPTTAAARPAPTTVAPTTTTTTTTTLPIRLPTRVSSNGVHISDRPVIPVGTEDNGELEVPGADEIGWYERGGTPGRPGATVLAAHVTWNGDLGPFYELGRSQAGDIIDVVLDDGSTRQYVVVEVAMYDKYELPGDRIWRREGPETLVLITCGGRFDESINRFRDNIVVFAEPLA